MPRRPSTRAFALFAAVSVLLCGKARGVSVGGKAPEISAKGWFNTRGCRLSGLRGKIVVVEFWATWCPPCRRSIPHLDTLHRKYEDKGVVIIGLTSEPRAKVVQFMKRVKMSYAVGANSMSGRAYGVRGIPQAFLVAPDGTVAWKGHPLSGLDEAIKKALKETPPTAGEPSGEFHRPVTVFVLTDGSRIEAVMTVDVGDSYSVKDKSGKMHVIKKDEVAELFKDATGKGAPGADEALPVYVLKDGRRIRAKNVVDAGAEFVIKDAGGKYHNVKKSDIAEVSNAGEGRPGAAAKSPTAPPAVAVAAPAPVTRGGAGARGGVAKSAGPAEWRDEADLESGETLRGLVVSEDEKSVVFDVVISGKSVSKTMLARITIQRDSIKEMRKLTEDQRARARQYLQDARQEAERDARAMKHLRVEPTEWVSMDGKRRKPARKVELEHFVIQADLEEEFLRKVAFRLAKVFSAYKEHFGVDRNEFEKVKVTIFNSLGEYHASLRAHGVKLLNPAFYAPDHKLMAAGFALAEYRAAIAAIRKHHAELNRQLQEERDKIDKARREVRKIVSKYNAQLHGRGRTTPQEAQQRRAIMRIIRNMEVEWEIRVMRMEKPLKEIQRRIKLFDRSLDLAFDEHAGLMIRAMYHEGFHAFLDQFLFDEGLVEHVPLWLNEGLAQYFENSRVEAGRLILGQEDRARLKVLRGFAREGTLISLEQVVGAGSDQFLVHEIGNAENSTKHYLMSWCVVHLLGEKGRLKKENIEAFVRALAKGRGPMDSLPLLTGMTNAELEAELDATVGSSIRLEAPPGK